MSRRVPAYVGLGANVGEPRTTLARAVRAMAALPGARLEAVSSLYRTRPVGVVDQPDFLNAVVQLDVPRGPDAETGALALLAALKRLEVALGRQARDRWHAREADLDLLLFGEEIISTQRPDSRWLEIPHPQMRQRLFVLAPLAELAPSLRPPGWTQTVAEAAVERRTVEGEDAVRLVGAWEELAGQWQEG